MRNKQTRVNMQTNKQTDFAYHGDTINRWDAIDAMKHTVCGDTWEVEQAIEAVNALPSAQPEIIRCKDCKWYGRADKRRFYRGMDCLQKHIDTIVPDRDFCSKAERKDDE